MEASTDLIRVVLPACDRKFTFHRFSLVLIFWTRKSYEEEIDLENCSGPQKIFLVMLHMRDSRVGGQDTLVICLNIVAKVDRGFLEVHHLP